MCAVRFSWMLKFKQKASGWGENWLGPWQTDSLGFFLIIKNIFMAKTTTLSAEIRISKSVPKTGLRDSDSGLNHSRRLLVFWEPEAARGSNKATKTKLQACDERIKINLRALKMFAVEAKFSVWASTDLRVTYDKQN